MEFNDKNRYIPGFVKREKAAESMHDQAKLLLFHENKLLMKKSGELYTLPEAEEISDILDLHKDDIEYIGKFDHADSFCLNVSDLTDVNESLVKVDLREVSAMSGDQDLFLLAGTANHILHWSSVNQYCGRCGTKTKEAEEERAKVCPSCGNMIFPRISPATITAIIKGDEILLAHNKKFRKDLYSLVAGFVEPGENLEQCVRREIMEEVGLKVKNIQYFSSQPWPFPDSLMFAFTAEYESGEIQVDNYEILDANWYKADALPIIPSTDSIAGKMIRWFRDNR